MAGSTETGPLAAVRRFVAGFNDDDVERAQAACTDDTAIVDDFPPYQWSGPGAAARWYREMSAMAGRYGMSDWSVVVDEPRQLMVSDQIAYAVVPVVARWQENGTPAPDRTGYLTAAFHELDGEWRISAFTWAWT